MTVQAVQPGQLLAGRYRVEDLLDEATGVRSWRAIDEVLSRAVFVHTMPTEDDRAESVTSAARAASQVGDPRFLQVLDVDVEADTVYVVREWITGQNLKTLLADGPLTADQATALGREVAEALSSAHRQGLTHRRLEPSSVVIAPNGTVKVAGLATEAALHGSPEGDPAELDAAGVGRILYAALTARWPDEDGQGLPVAPRIDGRFASPRQVRPGVPRLLDEIVDRTLGNSERHNAESLRSPAAVAEALTSNATTPSLSNGVLGDTGDDAWPPPAVLNDPTPPPLLSTRAVPVAQMSDERSPTSQIVARGLAVFVALVFLAGAGWLGLQMLLNGDTTADRTVVPSPEPAEPTEAAEDETDEQTPTPEAEDDATPDAEPEPSIDLSADPSSVAVNQRINLTGTVEPAVEGVELRVERRLGDGAWESFPDANNPVTTRTRAGGQFNTWVQTGRQGENDWRLVGTVDGETIESNTATVTVN